MNIAENLANVGQKVKQNGRQMGLFGRDIGRIDKFFTRPSSQLTRKT
jgi:hypothetical protein